MIIGPATRILRDYQDHCIEGGDPHHGIGVLPCLGRYGDALVVMATGCGKSSVFLGLIRRYLASPKTPPGSRALVISHRDELVTQPIEQAAEFGLAMAREQGADTGVNTFERAVSTSVQTMISRKERYRPDEFGLIVIDECHHAPSDIYRSVLGYFPDAYKVGFTATADRGDGIGLNEVFSAVAFEYNTETAMENGWLVPPIPKRYVIDGLDLDKLRARAGELPPEELGELMANYAHTAAGVLVDHTRDHQAIAFCCTVAHAYAQAEALKRYTHATIAVADGTTDKDERRRMVRDFRDGKIQYLINAQLWTEGFDAPNATVCAMLRPTLSRSFYAQCAGRVLRPLPGVVDRPELRHDPAGRRAAIAASAKPAAYILDFAGVSERHSLVGPLDALAGRLTTEERLALVKVDLVGDTAADVTLQEIRKAAAIEATRKAAEMERAAALSYDVDPFHPVHALGIHGLRDNPKEPRASPAMARFLAANGVAAPEKMSASTAQKIRGTIAMRDKFKLATLTQAMTLQRAGVPPASLVKMKLLDASRLMIELARNRNVRPRSWDSDPSLGGR